MANLFYVALCRPGQDSTAEEQLWCRGYRVYRPVLPSKIITRRNKLQQAHRSMFPGYLFIKEPDIGWNRLHGTPGMAFEPLMTMNNRLVYFREDNHDFRMIWRKQEELWEGFDEQPKAPFKVGERVRITQGPWVEFLGTIETIDKAGRIGCLVEMLRRHVRVYVDPRHVEQLSSAP